VQELLLDAIPTARDSQASAWLVSRGLDPDRIDAECVAAVLPFGIPQPDWTRGPGGAWSATDHRLLLAAVDATGAVVTVRARRIGDGPGPKTLSPWGHTTVGTVFADLVAHGGLARNRTPLQWAIVEGDVDFLTWATRRPWERPTPVAVLGIYAGSWTQALADRIPTGARVVLRLHADAAGEAYRAKVVASLHRRVELTQGGAS
jgi:hypothetical protein